jgi:hypothetical protein
VQYSTVPIDKNEACMKKHLYSIVVFFCGMLFCSKELSGPTTEQGNPQVSAFVADSLYNPVADADVVLLRLPPPDSTTTSQSQSQIPPANAERIGIGKSRSDGTCVFVNLIDGRYRLEAIDNAGMRSVLSKTFSISSNVNALHQDTLILRTPGTIRGNVSRSGVIRNDKLANAFIQIRIRELDRYFITDQSGSYLFPTIPRGTYTLLFYAADEYFTQIVSNVVVRSADTTTVNPVVLLPYPKLVPPEAFSYTYDANSEVVTFTWKKVTYEKFRYYEVLRMCDNIQYEKKWKTTDTLLTDTLRNLPASLGLSYVIHSVDSAYNTSENAGPVSIVVSKR